MEKVKYIIKPNYVHHTYDIFEKDYRNNLTFHSSHDSLEEAVEEKESLNTRPSMMDTLKFFKSLTSSLTKQN